MNMKKRYLVVLFVILFFVFWLLYITGVVNNIDNIMYKFIISIKNDYVTSFMKFITFFASTYFILFLMSVFFILSFFKGKIFNIINLLIVGDVIINRVVKVIVRRERPILINLVTEKSFSFPSGHTMVAVTLYGFIIYLINKSNLSKKFKIILNFGLILLILLILISRIYLGVHYFSDVIAGLFLALAYLIFIVRVLERKNIL